MKESDFDHMALVVEMDKPYLVDLGFGEHFLTQPIPIVDGYILRDRSGVYQIRKVDERYVLEKAGRNRWVLKYSFQLYPRKFKEFERTFIRHIYFRSGFNENAIYSRWINDNLFIRVYNQWVTLYKNQSIRKFKMEVFKMNNNWLNEGFVMMMGSSDDSGWGGGRKTSPCWCKDPRDANLQYMYKEDYYGKVYQLWCRTCGWRDVDWRPVK